MIPEQAPKVRAITGFSEMELLEPTMTPPEMVAMMH
jgi:hypothetical protein